MRRLLGILAPAPAAVAVRPHGVSQAELNALNRRLMDACEAVVALRAAGYEADLFLVPSVNYQEARRYARTARFVPVDRLWVALDALCGLDPEEGTPAKPPAPARNLRASR